MYPQSSINIPAGPKAPLQTMANPNFNQPQMQGNMPSSYQWWQNGSEGGPENNNPYGHDLYYRLQQALGSGAFGSASFLSNFVQPNWQKAITNAFGMTTPEGATTRARGLGQATMAESAALARRQAMQAGANGASSALQQGIVNSGINRGREMATQQFAQVADPFNTIREQLGVLQQGSQSPIMQMIMQLAGTAPMVPPTNQSGIGNVLAGALGSTPWGQIFAGGGGGGLHFPITNEGSGGAENI